jgi:hypothetical protein
MPFEFDNIEQAIRYLDGKAVEHAKQVYQVLLDHSVRSVEDVEKILARLHEHYLATQSEEGIFGLAMFYGAYVGEVIRRNDLMLAEWAGNVSLQTFPSLSWHARHGGESRVFPMSWCYARMIEGPGDNVWFKYQACIVRDEAIVETVKQIGHRRNN